MRPGGGGGDAAAARAEAEEATKALARKQVRAWMRRVLQPSAGAWGGWGVARPSAFCEAGPDFLQQCAEVMGDRGGEGSWKWARLPPGVVTQGAPRAAGGAARERGWTAPAAPRAETPREAAERAAAERRRLAKARTRQRLADERAAFKAELKTTGGSVGWEAVLARAAARPGAAVAPPAKPPPADAAAARAQAVAAYARVKDQRAAAQRR